MSPERKAAIAKSRAETKAVREYLGGLRATKPKGRRTRSPESIQTRLEAIENALLEADPVSELLLIQERRDLQDELSSKAVDNDAIEDRFIEVAKDYGQRKNISYASWRDAGVPPAVLKRAGISRST